MTELSGIIEAGPQGVSLDTGVGTTSIVVKLVKDSFDVSYYPDHMGRILHGLGYSVQRPGKKLSKADENLQRTWSRDEPPEIKKSERERGVVLYGDEAVFQQTVTVIRTWALVGIGIHVLSWVLFARASKSWAQSGSAPSRSGILAS